METIQSAEILLPVVVMVLLTIAVFLWTVVSRVTQMNKARIHPQQVKTRSEMAAKVTDSRASDHLANMFEAPVLFYVACIVVYLLGISDSLFLGLAWLFVSLRFAQALIHLSVNHVTTRASVFGLGLLMVLVIWVRIAIELFRLV